MASPAERQRRYRAHHKGDHSLCDPARCNGVTRDAVTRHGAPDLGKRGRRLWRELTAGDVAPAELVLIEEACRIADRLDRLDAQLRGDADAWLRFVVDDTGAEVTITIDKALAEARQQAVALKALLAELRASRAPAKTGRTVAGRPASTVPEVPRGVADLTQRIRDRSAQASG